MRTSLLFYYLLFMLLILAACAPNQPAPVDAPIATPTPNAAAQTLVPAPTATGLPAPEAVAASESPLPAAPAATEPVRYQGPSPYGAQFADFEVWYDPAVWEFVHDNNTGRQDQLYHREDATCSMWLQAGPIGVTPRGEATLAGRVWAVGGDTIDAVGAFVALYSLRVDDAGYVIGVILPAGEEVGSTNEGACRRAAEEVMDTFAIVGG